MTLRGLSCLAAMLLLVTASPAPAQTVAPESVHWSVAPAFAKDAQGRENISGAACAPTQPAFQSCLVVNDQKKYAQFFSIAGSKIVPGAVIRLLGDSAEGDPDAEGAAYHEGYFYVIGSHGAARKDGKLQAASFLVFRFKVNAQTGKPAFEVTDSRVAPAIEKSNALRAAIRKAELIGPFAEKPLSANGVNIEGLAVDDERLYVGFRGPSIDGRVFILSAAVDGLFGLRKLEPTVHSLALGPGTGIRDLARVEGGMLVLAGPVNEQEAAPAVFHWNAASGALKKLADLSGTPAGAKAETLLVLERQPQGYRVLVMHDGPANGQPVEYSLPRE